MTVVDAAAPAATAVVARRPRYPGSPPFSDTEVDRRLFRGRDREAHQLLHSILSERLVVLYGASGTGKTSLLKARIMQELRDREMWPVVVRLDQPARTPVDQVVEQTRQQASGTVELIEPMSKPGSLWDLFAGLEIWRGDTLLTPVVIFDQFEELFTLDWTPAHRAAFVADFAHLVHGRRPAADAGEVLGRPPRLKMVLCLREDSLGELEELAADVPGILRHRFRLKALDLDQARAAIVEPARLEDPRLASPPFEYSDSALSLMTEFLSTREVRGRSVQQSTVEPSQLQIVCQHVEDVVLPTKRSKELPTDPLEITDADLGGRDGLNDILEEFYGRQLARFDEGGRADIRNLCETGLISPTRRRMSREEEEIHREYGVAKAELLQLVEQRLVRAEPRVGSVYYELAHDSLVEPILSYRDRAVAEKRQRRVRKLAGVVGAVVTVVVLGAVAFGVFGSRGGRSAIVVPADLVGGEDFLGVNVEPGVVGAGTDLAMIDLTGATLRDVGLAGISMTDALLVGADLTGADLTGADLSGADLTDAIVTSEMFRPARLRGTTLAGVDLSGAPLAGLDLSSADLRSADLTDADLTQANLSGADLTGATVDGANLGRAQLSRATLTDVELLSANLTGAMLGGATLSGLDLSEAPLGGMDLSSADLRFANLTSADLRGADLSGADLTGATVVGAAFDGARLSRAILSGLDLSAARLGGLDLSGADLGLADLTSADLRGADLSGADLSNATVTGADFSRATLRDAILGRVDLSGAALSGLDLTGANLDSADLSRANLREATLEGALLPGAGLIRADLANARLDRADLIDADLSDATLTGASLVGAQLVGANLSGAALIGADLRESDLQGADLTDAALNAARLGDAVLVRANLTGTDLTGADLGGASLEDVVHSDETRWPEGYVPPRSDAGNPEAIFAYDTGGKPVVVSAGDAHVWVAVGPGGVFCLDPSTSSLLATSVGGVASVAADPSGGAWALALIGRSVELVRIGACGEPGVPVATWLVGDVDQVNLAVGEGSLWVVAGRSGEMGSLYRIDPDEPDRGVSEANELGLFPVDVAVGGEAVWVTNLDSDTVTRVDPANLTAVEYPVGDEPLGLAVGPDAIWVANRSADTVTRLDLTDLDGEPVTIAVGENPDGVAIGPDGGPIWVTNAVGDTVSRIDPTTGAVDAVLEVGDRPDGIAVGFGFVWVANSFDGTVTQIDPGS